LYIREREKTLCSLERKEKLSVHSKERKNSVYITTEGHACPSLITQSQMKSMLPGDALEFAYERERERERDRERERETDRERETHTERQREREREREIGITFLIHTLSPSLSETVACV
jgi:hypothetical protein